MKVLFCISSSSVSQYLDPSSLCAALKASSIQEVTTLRSQLNKIREGVELLLDELYPSSVGSNNESQDRVLELLQSAPKKLKDLIFESANTVCRQALAMIKSFFPNITLELIEAGFAAGTTAEEALQLLDENNSLSKAIVKDVLESDSEESDDK